MGSIFDALNKAEKKTGDRSPDLLDFNAAKRKRSGKQTPDPDRIDLNKHSVPEKGDQSGRIIPDEKKSSREKYQVTTNHKKFSKDLIMIHQPLDYKCYQGVWLLQFYMYIQEEGD